MPDQEKPVLRSDEYVGRWVMFKKPKNTSARRAYVLACIDAMTVQIQTDNGSRFDVELSEIIGVTPWNKMQVVATTVVGAADTAREMLDALVIIDGQLDCIQHNADVLFPQCAIMDSETTNAGLRLADPEHIGMNPGVPRDGGNPITATRTEARHLRAVVHLIFGAIVARDEQLRKDAHVESR